MGNREHGGQEGYGWIIYEVITVVQVKEDGNLDQSPKVEMERSG